jgi:Uma2 family endonuclease
MAVKRRYTSADLENLPDEEGIRHEIIDGVLYVSRAPHTHHQHAIHGIELSLGLWNRRSNAGFVLPGVGFIFDPENDVIPDLVWISRERYFSGVDDAGHFHIAPELAVEVLSPGSRNEARDRRAKLGLYSRQGVVEYWIVDWRRREVEVYRRDGDELRLTIRLGGDAELTSPLLEGFTCPLADLWPPEL